MNAYYATDFVLNLPAGHRFPMEKYALLRDAIAAEHPGVHLSLAPAATDGQLAMVHTPDYIDRVSHGGLSVAAQREIGFPWSPQMSERARRSVGASIAAARDAMQQGIAANMAGGTHHAYADKGAGFCVFNDMAVTARVLQSDWLQTRGPRGRPMAVAIVDLDVHQGNGTAHLFSRDETVFTLSVHGEKNFPFRKEASDLDLALPDGTGDDRYLETVETGLRRLSERFAPDLVLYLAGADIHEGDRLGRLKVTDAGMRARDLKVFSWAKARGLPLAFAMAGGYGRDIATTVAVQVQTFATATSLQCDWQVTIS
ncbi:histone deacetylase [Burkholderiaceae bacterium]|nr:histone deacetylase [Burkholderiaceae bacterium]